MTFLKEYFASQATPHTLYGVRSDVCPALRNLLTHPHSSRLIREGGLAEPDKQALRLFLMRAKLLGTFEQVTREGMACYAPAPHR